MNNAEQKKLTAEANKLLRSGKSKSKPKKYPGTNLPFKVFAQTSGHFPPGLTPLICHIKTPKELESRNCQLGRLEFLPNKTYYKANLKHEGIYFYNNLKILLRKDFYFEPSSSGFISLTFDGKIIPMTEEEVQRVVGNQPRGKV